MGRPNKNHRNLNIRNNFPFSTTPTTYYLRLLCASSFDHQMSSLSFVSYGDVRNAASLTGFSILLFFPLSNSQVSFFILQPTASFALLLPFSLTTNSSCWHPAAHRLSSSTSKMAATPQAKTLALLPKFTGSFSLIGSVFIFQDIVFHGKTSPAKRVFHRVMLGLSSADAVASVMNVLSTWPIPEGTPGVYLASGTVQTCTAQGFFNELGNVATPLYNASLCVYFARKIRDGWTEDGVQYNNERSMHFVPLSVALTIAVLGLIFDLYNNSGWLCWFAENPFGCAGNPDVECVRGQLAEPFRWAHYAIIWSAICFSGYEMYSIYAFVRAYERTEENDRGTKAKKVAIQAGLFVGALYLTWFFTTVRACLRYSAADKRQNTSSNQI